MCAHPGGGRGAPGTSFPPPGAGGCAKLGEVQLELPDVDLSLPDGSVVPQRERRIYCNRSLRLDQVSWVGFDMDYTLAIYDQQEMDRLSIKATVDKMLARGYPERLGTLDYPVGFPVRGLLIDRKLGNMLKMDRYGYVKRAYHGMRELSLEERRGLYHTRKLRLNGPRYHWIDTLYGLSEVTMFAAGVTELEAAGQRVDYGKLFEDIRECVDLSHQDGSILDHITKDPPRYVKRDPELPGTLHKLRSAGKKLFLLTNSQRAYTERMMAFLLDDALPEYGRWTQYFDVAICAARKPSFFTGEAPFMLEGNNGSPTFATKLERGQLYSGGCLEELVRHLGAEDDRVLYVGDHIYGDVLKSKKTSAWRTAMIIQEMEEELHTVRETGEASDRWDRLEEARRAMLDELRTLSAAHKQRLRDTDMEDASQEAERTRLKRRVERTRARLKGMEAELEQIEDEMEAHFHDYWGPLFKAGGEASMLGHQIENYACLYTSRVSNMAHYSPMHYFKSPRDRMPHEVW